jgi:hypothetical protein
MVGVMLGSRKPLNRSHIPGTLATAPSGIDCSAQASTSGSKAHVECSCVLVHCATAPRSLRPAVVGAGAGAGPWRTTLHTHTRTHTHTLSPPPPPPPLTSWRHLAHRPGRRTPPLLALGRGRRAPCWACRRQTAQKAAFRAMRLMIDEPIYAPLGGNPSELTRSSPPALFRMD